MTRLTDGERELLAEQEADAREIGRHDDPPTDDELDEMAEGYDCLSDRCKTCGDVLGQFNWYGQCEECVTKEEEQADDDTREFPY